MQRLLAVAVVAFLMVETAPSLQEQTEVLAVEVLAQMAATQMVAVIVHQVKDMQEVLDVEMVPISTYLLAVAAGMQTAVLVEDRVRLVILVV